LIKEEQNKNDIAINIPESEDPESSSLSKISKQNDRKKVKRKKGFLQMRIDSTIYFDNMGYSYQIQNEKNDKK